MTKSVEFYGICEAMQHQHLSILTEEGSAKPLRRIVWTFMVSGTTAVATTRANRNWVGSEFSKEYADLVNVRLLKERKESLDLK